MIYIDKNIRKSVVHQHYLLSSIITFSFSKTENGKKKLFIFKFLTQQPIHPIVTPFLIRKPRSLVNNSSIGDLPSNAGDNYYSLGRTPNDVRHYQLICNHKILITLKKCKSLVLPLQ